MRLLVVTKRQRVFRLTKSGRLECAAAGKLNGWRPIGTENGRRSHCRTTRMSEAFF
jgi:hypothetical protein